VGARRQTTATFDAAWQFFVVYPVAFVLVFVATDDLDAGTIAFVGVLFAVVVVLQFGFLQPYRIVLDADELHLRYLLRPPRGYLFHEIDSAAKLRLSTGWIFWFRDGRKALFPGPLRGSRRLRDLLEEHGVETRRTFFGFGSGTRRGG